MACPYFYPTEAMDGKRWPSPPRLPLGDPYAGICKARAEPYVPGESALRNLCNQGYARGSCAEFPVDAGPDAIRFGIARDSGGIVRIAFIVERDHLPHGHGAIEYSRELGWLLTEQLPASPAEEIRRKQTEAYLESFLRRKPA
ncbi:MAG: hypothetical protein M3Z23_08265 [Acidobacteriota bacterium]|nr:hypothetical protein [Acidobacteriota bacterium]